MTRTGRLSLVSLLLVTLLSFSATTWPATPAPGTGLPEELQATLFPVQDAMLLEQSTVLDNPDLPLLMLATPTLSEPVIVVIDARNGKETWAMNQDPIIAVATFDGRQWIDTGVMTGGPATGTFTAVGSPQETLSLLRQLIVRRTTL